MDSLLFQRKMWIATHGPNMYVSLRAYMQASESMDGQPMVAAEIIQRSKLKEAEGSAPILSVEKMRHPFLSGAAGGEYACVRRDACQCACACVTASVCACVCVDVCVVPVCPSSSSHPHTEYMYVHEHTGGMFVPTSFELGKRLSHSDLGTATSNCLILTGPNMGGKSTTLRLACFAALLAQLGCYVPAEACKVCQVKPVHRTMMELLCTECAMCV